MKDQTAARSSSLQPVSQPRTAKNAGRAQTLGQHASGTGGHRGRHSGSIPELCRIGQTDPDRGTNRRTCWHAGRDQGAADQARSK